MVPFVCYLTLHEQRPEGRDTLQGVVQSVTTAMGHNR